MTTLSVVAITLRVMMRDYSSHHAPRDDEARVVGKGRLTARRDENITRSVMATIEVPLRGEEQKKQKQKSHKG